MPCITGRKVSRSPSCGNMSHSIGGVAAGEVRDYAFGQLQPTAGMPTKGAKLAAQGWVNGAIAGRRRLVGGLIAQQHMSSAEGARCMRTDESGRSLWAGSSGCEIALLLIAIVQRAWTLAVNVQRSSLPSQGDVRPGRNSRLLIGRPAFSQECSRDDNSSNAASSRTAAVAR